MNKQRESVEGLSAFALNMLRMQRKNCYKEQDRNSRLYECTVKRGQEVQPSPSVSATNNLYPVVPQNSQHKRKSPNRNQSINKMKAPDLSRFHFVSEVNKNNLKDRRKISHSNELRTKIPAKQATKPRKTTLYFEGLPQQTVLHSKRNSFINSADNGTNNQNKIDDSDQIYFPLPQNTPEQFSKWTINPPPEPKKPETVNFNDGSNSGLNTQMDIETVESKNEVFNNDSFDMNCDAIFQAAELAENLANNQITVYSETFKEKTGELKVVEGQILNFGVKHNIVVSKQCGLSEKCKKIEAKAKEKLSKFKAKTSLSTEMKENKVDIKDTNSGTTAKNKEIKKNLMEASVKKLERVPKRNTFQAPLKKNLKQTTLISFANPVKDGDELNQTRIIIELNMASLRDMVFQMQEAKPKEVCMSLVYTGNILQLQDPDCPAKVQGIFLRTIWLSKDVEYCYISSDLLQDAFPDGCQSGFELFQLLLTDFTCCTVSLEASELMLYLIHKLKYTRAHTHKWRLFDPLLGYWLLQPDASASTFKELLLKLGMNTIPSTTARDWQQKSCQCLDLLSESYNAIKIKLKEEHLWSIFVDIEVPLCSVLAGMSARGIYIDGDRLRALGDGMKTALIRLEEESRKVAGCALQMTSAQQLRHVLYDVLKLDKAANLVVKGTAGGAKSTCESVLRQLRHAHPLPDIVLRHRKVNKLRTTFVDGILPFVRKDVLHCVWEQRAAATGRLACSNPNLQAIPKHWVSLDDASDNINIRSVFRPRENHVFVLADFQHIELRMFAHLSEDQGLIEMFKSDDDVFVKLTSRWRGGKDAEVTSIDRDKTKRILYSLLYGAGPLKLAEYLEISNSDATAVYNSFCSVFPVIKRFTNWVAMTYGENGRLVTLQGRVRHFPKMRDSNRTVRAQVERQAVNYLIQGSAADLCKRAMLLTEQAINSAQPALDAHLILQIHDELVWEVPEHQKDRLTELVTNVMEDTTALNGGMPLNVPIKVRVVVQSNWAT